MCRHHHHHQQQQQQQQQHHNYISKQHFISYCGDKSYYLSSEFVLFLNLRCHF
jgi:hypothetical protein